MIDVYLKPGRDKSARQRHPWVFSRAVKRVEGNVQPGEVVRVLDGDRSFVAYGYLNPVSQIRIRLLEWNEERMINDEWWYQAITAAVRARDGLLSHPDTNACRLVFSEADLLPGLIVDKYAEYLVMQSLTVGIEQVKGSIVTALAALVKPVGIFERSDAEVRAIEGLPASTGALYGDEPPDRLLITQNGLRFFVDVKRGHKTGFYLDQRDNCRLVGSYAAGRDVLDCFSYAGAFSVYAMSNRAKSAILIDDSRACLVLAEENLRLNGFTDSAIECVKGDVFMVMRRLRDDHRLFDMVILDPPKFAGTRSNLKRALQGYKDINLQAMNLLRPGGILATFSCSGAVDWQSFKVAIFWASLDAGRTVQHLHTLSQPADHPRLASFPGSEYLKGLICRVM
ncbi:MAG TPA: class I SAM-dependent rRNA methyltransferase [Candidatus Deferrimicrobium sp.]|nr:class I SAM-dependent rRNA methyltransferase [Candidatus Deferrimicrobium sp.]